MPNENYKKRISEFHNIEDEGKYPPFPLKGLHIELSNICNHQCLFCANRKMTRKKGFIDEQLLLKVLRDAYDNGFREVGYYANGEPFMSPKLSEYIKWAKQLGYTYVYIDTNGGAVEFDRIKEAIDAGLDSIKFSINGTNKQNYMLIHGKDDFNKVINNLKLTYEYKNKYNHNLNVFVSVAVTKYIKDSIDQFKQGIKEFCDEIVTNSVIEMGGYISEELKCLQTDQNADFTKGMSIPCYLLWKSLFITYEGYATACCADFQNYFAYADLNKVSLKEAWHNPVISELRGRHLIGDVAGLPCVTCACGEKREWQPLMKEYATICHADELCGYDVETRIEEYERGYNK